jgi:flavodoxin
MVKVFVVYDTKYGNTKLVARKILNALAALRLNRVDKARPMALLGR